MTIIESADYEETRQRLVKDPIVIAMAEEIKRDKDYKNFDISMLVHNEDPNDPRPTPRFEFMMAANKEYQSRGGKDGGHIGGIAEAILRLVNG
jgi:hypothetical protein